MKFIGLGKINKDSIPLIIASGLPAISVVRWKAYGENSLGSDRIIE